VLGTLTLEIGSNIVLVGVFATSQVNCSIPAVSNDASILGRSPLSFGCLVKMQERIRSSADSTRPAIVAVRLSCITTVGPPSGSIKTSASTALSTITRLAVVMWLARMHKRYKAIVDTPLEAALTQNCRCKVVTEEPKPIQAVDLS